MVGEEPATVNALPAGARQRRAIPATPLPSHSMQIALATLREEEAETARLMIHVGRGLGIAAVAALPFIGGSELAAHRDSRRRIAFAVVVGIPDRARSTPVAVPRSRRT